MRYILVIFISSSLFAETSFITKMEYASELYKNPRGIGCQNCHGDDGHGKVIARYISKNKEKALIGSDITKVDYDTFDKSLSKGRRWMPIYYLTKDEKEALYFFVTKHKRELKNGDN